MAIKKNISDYFWSEQERISIVGGNIVNLRTVPALERLSKYKMDSFLLLYIQASIILGLAFISSFLWYLLKSKFQFTTNDIINANVLSISYSLFLLPFFLMSFTIIYKPIIKIWMSLLSAAFIFFLLNSILYYQPHEYYPLIVPLFDSSVLTITVAISSILFLISIIFWRPFFWTSIVVFSIIITTLAINLSHVKSPEIQSALKDKSYYSAPANNIIHIAINNHINIPFLLEIEKGNSEASKIITKFYNDYNFKLFPKAYSLYKSSVDETNNILNFETLKPSTIIQKSDIKYFNTSNGLDAFLSDNKYFNLIGKNNYRVSIYQNYGVDLCYMGGGFNLGQCYTSYPINSIVDDEEIFYAYISSFLSNEYFSNIDAFTYNNMPVSLGQQELFNKAQQDIIKARGKNLFFIQVASLKHPYVFDSNCNIIKKSKGVIGYTNQLSCTYKMLGKFMSTLDAAGVLAHSKVIIHGLNGANINLTQPKKQKNHSIQEGFLLAKDMYMSIFAYYSPTNSRFNVNYTACNISSLLIKSVGNREHPCSNLNIRDYAIDNSPRFNVLITNWLNSISD